MKLYRGVLAGRANPKRPERCEPLGVQAVVRLKETGRGAGIGSLLACAVMVAGIVTVAAATTPVVRAQGWPAVDAEAVCVMDAASFRILYTRNPDLPLRPASTTKIMTALVAMEQGNLQDVVTISRHASRVEGSRVYLDEGERQTLRDLLYALMLRSANDAAIAIAEHLAGSEKEFARLMNERAHALGATRTCFANPHGLDAPGHYTTARDLALISAHAMKNPAFREVVGTRQWEMPWPARETTRKLYTENRLLWQNGGDSGYVATGVKTGYTQAAGHCVAASARKDGMEVVVVLLKAGRGFWDDVRTLFDYAFANYRPVTIVRAGETLGTLTLPSGRTLVGAAGRDVVVPLARWESAAPKPQVATSWEPGLRAPLAAGQRVGQAEVRCPDIPPVIIPVVAAEAVSPPSRLRTWLWALPFLATIYVVVRTRRQRRLQKWPVSRTRGGWAPPPRFRPRPGRGIAPKPRKPWARTMGRRRS
ncbi:MAG: D-alanyl-D-alanine carboxypeptidase family protein [Bacillota bacterium]